MQPPMGPSQHAAQQQDYGGDMPFPAVKLRGLPFDVEPIAIASLSGKICGLLRRRVHLQTGRSLAEGPCLRDTQSVLLILSNGLH